MKKIIIAVFAGLIAGAVFAGVPFSVNVPIVNGSGTYTNSYITSYPMAIDALPTGNTATTNTLTVSHTQLIPGGITFTNTLGTATIAQNAAATIVNTNSLSISALEGGWFLINTNDLIPIAGCGTNTGNVRLQLISWP